MVCGHQLYLVASNTLGGHGHFLGKTLRASSVASLMVSEALLLGVNLGLA